MPIYKVSMEEARWGAIFPESAYTSAQDWGQMLTFEGKCCSLFRSFTSFLMCAHLINLVEILFPPVDGGQVRELAEPAFEYEELLRREILVAFVEQESVVHSSAPGTSLLRAWWSIMGPCRWIAVQEGILPRQEMEMNLYGE
jgi:hypothetical protein